MTRRRNRIAVMGVDPSMTSTGLALPGGDTLTLKNDLREWARIVYVVAQTKKAMESERVTHICMEGYAFGRMGQRGTFDMAELGGILKLLFLSEGKSIVLVPPTTLKSYATGKGNAPKEVVMKEIKRRWGKSFVSSDRADAFALQRFGTDYLTEAKTSVGELSALGKATYIEAPEYLQTFARIG